MIYLQIVEQPGAHLYRELIHAMRSGELRTFSVAKRGRKVTHSNANYPGWIKWSAADGIVACSIVSPRKPGSEWRLLSAFLGRLADKYPHLVHSVNIQFQQAAPPRRRPRRSARKR